MHVSHIHYSYPQPPFHDSSPNPTKINLAGAPDDVKFGEMGLRDMKRVHCLSNPATFSVNEVVIGITSTDVLFHLSAQETNANLPPGSRLTRLAQHLLQQKSYYPLFPAPIPLDFRQDWSMPDHRPDVLILPSRLKALASPLLKDSTLVINPGRLVKGLSGGSFAKMTIAPMPRMEDTARDVRLLHQVVERCRVQVQKI